MASTDSSRGSDLLRRTAPNLVIPAPDIPSLKRAAIQETARTGRWNHRRHLSWENKTVRDNALADHAYPSQQQNLQSSETLSRSQLQRGEFTPNQLIGFAPVEVFHAIDRIAQFLQHAVLYPSTRHRCSVRDTMERHHRILRHKDTWIPRFQRQLYLLTEKKAWVGHAVPHLCKILYREVGNGISIDLPRFLKLHEDVLPLGPMPIEQLHKSSAVFKTAVQSLAEEGNNGMCGIAQEQRMVLHMPGRTLDGDHGSRWVGEEVVCEIGHQQHRIRKAGAKEFQQLRFGCYLGKAIGTFKRQK